VIFFALLTGAELLGVLGMLLAVPTAALLKSLLETYGPLAPRKTRPKG